jgi:hypothetical protein
LKSSDLSGKAEGEVRRMLNVECEMRNELAGNVERRVLSLAPNNSELRT